VTVREQVSVQAPGTARRPGVFLGDVRASLRSTAPQHRVVHRCPDRPPGGTGAAQPRVTPLHHPPPGTSASPSPAPSGAGGDAGDVQAPGGVFEEHRRVQAPAEGSIEMQEVDGDGALGLVGEELPPGRAVTARGRVNARRAQDLPDRGGSDRVPETGQFALDPPMAPLCILERAAGSALERRLGRRASSTGA
jgi:hypothetical protein